MWVPAMTVGVVSAVRDLATKTFSTRLEMPIALIG